MSDEIESIGAAVTGGLVARAVEPRAGEPDEAESRQCLNCGATLLGPYCHQCGQKGRVHRRLKDIGHDIAHSVLHLDGKIWRTLPLLFFKPGQLTRRYIEGERAKFVSPMALFLFSVFMMFAVFTAVGGPFAADAPGIAEADAQAEFDTEKRELSERLAELAEQKRAREAEGLPTDRIDAEIADVRRGLQAFDALGGLLGAANPAGAAQAEEKAAGTPASADKGRQIDTDRNSETGSVPLPNPDNPNFRVVGFETGWPSLDAAIRKANENPRLTLYKVQANAYKFSWALIPISVTFVALLFLWRRRFKLYDHTVFVTYSIAAMTLGIVFFSLLRPLGVGSAWFWTAIMFLPPVHMYLQLRGAYQLGRFSALWRTFFLAIFAIVAAMLFFLLLLAIGILA